MLSSLASFVALSLASLISAVLATADVQQQSDLAFSYTGAKGPENWGKLNLNYSACAAGKIQSPVNIARDQAEVNKNLTPLDREYHPSNATLANNGFNIGVLFEDGRAGGMLLNGMNYSLKQLHWHSPSEHTLDSTRYALELHLVHSARNGSLAVIAILYDYGRADPFIAKVTNQLKELARDSCSADEESHIPLGVISIRQFKRSTRKYYRYVGSLTSPPCTEQVTWTILGKVRSVSKEQVELLRAPLGADYKNNSRPVQPLEGRQIELYTETDNDN
ncbi:hypothetical protein MLD38_026637 [Melastoma candidum]|uniref:Uncharacterized protein n=1 Tax=Melastoma candidum TaxID=119954 RepID=A0ACB9P051_9MYRT|nr:hypothetical protein MLD38_026637 [Melastoma candidum]